MEYFEVEENKRKLIEELESWIGTPYRHMSCVKQAGVDCGSFVLAVFKSIGVTKSGPDTLPKYPRSVIHVTTEEILYKEFKVRRRQDFKEVNKRELFNGDILLFQFGKTACHCAILCDSHIYQASDMLGVMKHHYNDSKWIRRIRHAFRVKYNG